MEERHQCQEQCQYRIEEKCALDIGHLTYPVYGALCCEDLFEDEIKTYY